MIVCVTTYGIELRSVPELDAAVEFATLPIGEIGSWLRKAFGEVATYLERKGARPAGMPFARYLCVSDGRVDIEAGFAASTPTNGHDPAMWRTEVVQPYRPRSEKEHTW